jgi:hydrogenase maturation protease
MKRLLVAGVGNVFRGDDAFGVEVAKYLAGRTWSDQVDVADFGIRGIDLTYALLDRYDAALLIDTFRQGGEPGTLYVVEPEPPGPDVVRDPGDLTLTPHDLDPAKVLRMVRAMEGRCRQILLVGCEPADLGDDWDGKMGLSDAVAEATRAAVGVVDRLVREWLGAQAEPSAEPPTERTLQTMGGGR